MSAIILPEEPWASDQESRSQGKKFASDIAKNLNVRAMEKSFTRNKTDLFLNYFKLKALDFKIYVYFGLSSYTFSSERIKSSNTWTPFVVSFKHWMANPGDHIPDLSKAVGVSVLSGTSELELTYARKFILHPAILKIVKDIDFDPISRMELSATQLLLESKQRNSVRVCGQIELFRKLVHELYNLVYPRPDSAEHYRQKMIAASSVD